MRSTLICILLFTIRADIMKFNLRSFNPHRLGMKMIPFFWGGLLCREPRALNIHWHHWKHIILTFDQFFSSPTSNRLPALPISFGDDFLSEVWMFGQHVTLTWQFFEGKERGIKITCWSEINIKSTGWKVVFLEFDRSCALISCFGFGRDLGLSLFASRLSHNNVYLQVLLRQILETCHVCQ